MTTVSDDEASMALNFEWVNVAIVTPVLNAITNAVELEAFTLRILDRQLLLSAVLRGIRIQFVVWDADVSAVRNEFEWRQILAEKFAAALVEAGCSDTPRSFIDSVRIR